MVILSASIVSVVCQMSLLYVWVKVQNNQKKTEVAFEESFWYWKSFSKYMEFFGQMVLILTVATVVGGDKGWFVDSLGFASAGVEAVMRAPQFWLNY